MPKTRFKELRKQRKLTQEELISQFNERYGKQYTASSISMFENNKRIPETQALMDFADFYGVSVDYLLGRTDIPEPLPPYINKNLTPPQDSPQAAPQASPQDRYITGLLGSVKDKSKLADFIRTYEAMTPREREHVQKYCALDSDHKTGVDAITDTYYSLDAPKAQKKKA